MAKGAPFRCGLDKSRTGFLFDLLLKTSYEWQLEEGGAPDHGWVPEIFSALKVPLVLQFQLLNDLFEAKLSPWSSQAGLVYLVAEISQFLERWMASLRVAPRASFARYAVLVGWDCARVVYSWCAHALYPCTLLHARHSRPIHARTSTHSNEFPARLIDESISKYLVTLHGDVKSLVATLHQIQSQIRTLSQ